ncbi:MAG: hypothetical protein IT376_18100 [Polyangiaceae bacterium]|nr:hypothetical protein [Polyangiaceae bacterium]
MTQSKWFALAALASLVVAAAACSGSDEDPKPGSTATGGTGGGGSGGAGATGGGSSSSATSCTSDASGYSCTCAKGAPAECCGATLPPMVVRKDDQLVAPDWSCIQGGGAGAGGAAGAPGDAGAGDAGPAQRVFEVEDFGGSSLVADVDVEVFEGVGILGKTPYVTGTTKGPSTPGPTELNNGQLYIPEPTTPYVSYRVAEKPGIAKQFVGIGLQVEPAPAKLSGATVSPSLYNQLATFAVPLPGWTPPTDLGIVTGGLRDCAGDDVGNVIFELIDESTGQPIPSGTGPRDPRLLYFDGSYPNPKCGYSDYRQSLFLVINAPTNDSGAGAGKKYKVRFLGRFTESDAAPRAFAEQSLEISQNSVTVYYVRPNLPQN